MRTNHMRGPYFCIRTLLGTSNRKYAMKNSPAPSPKAASPMPTSAPMCSWANPTAERST